MNEMVKLLAGSCLALSLAWLWDQLLIVSGIGQKLRIGVLIPAGEEIIKFSFVYFLYLSPPLFYFSFGLGEGLFESFNAPFRSKITVIIAGCIIHTIFSLFFLTSYPRYAQLILAIVAHCFWNSKIWNRIG